MKIETAFCVCLLFACSPLALLAQTTPPKLKQPAQEEPKKQSTVPAPANQKEVGADDVIKVNTTLINIPVSVMDRGGRFIPNLLRNDFHIYEDGVEQQIAFFAPVEMPFSVVLLIDTSPSTLPRQKEIKDAANAFISQLRPDDNVMVVTFNGEIRVLNKLNKNREALHKAISNIHWNGSGTLLYGTIDVLLNRFFKRLRGRKALVVLTDGQDSDPRPSIVANADERRKRGITFTFSPSCEVIPCVTYKSSLRSVEELDTIIYSIEYAAPIEQVLKERQKEFHEAIYKGYELGASYLLQIAEKTGGRYYKADEQQNLTQVFTSIADELRYQYSLGYYPLVQPESGQRRQIKVRVSQPGLAVRSRTGYIYAP